MDPVTPLRAWGVCSNLMTLGDDVLPQRHRDGNARPVADGQSRRRACRRA